MTDKFKYHYDQSIDQVPEHLKQIIDKGKKTNLKRLVKQQEKLKKLEGELERQKSYVRMLKSHTECEHTKHLIVHDHGVSCEWCNGFFKSETKLETTDE